MAKKAEQKVEEVVSEVKEEKVVSETAKSKKNSKTALKVIIITLVVALVAVGGFFAYRMFMSKNPVKVTSNAIRGLKDSLADAKDENSEIAKLLESDDAFEIKSKIKLDLPDSIGDDYLVNFLAQADKEDETFKFDIKAKEGSSTILDISALIDAAKVYFKLNDTMDNYYYTKIEETVDSFDIEKLPEIPDYDFENIIDYLADAIDGTLSKKDFDKEKDEITIKDKDYKVTKYTAELDEVKLKEIVDKFLDKVLKDKKLIKVIAEMTDADESDIKDAIKEIKEVDADDLGEISLDYSVYVTSSGEAIGYGFGFEGVEVIIANYKGVLSFQIVAQGMRAAIEAEKKSDNHYVITLDAMGMITGKLDIKTDFETVEKNEEYKYTLDANLSLSIYGQKETKGSLKAETTFKKIDKVDTSAKLGAKSVDSLSDIEQYQFAREVQTSSSYKLIYGLIESLEAVTPGMVNY